MEQDAPRPKSASANRNTHKSVAVSNSSASRYKYLNSGLFLQCHRLTTIPSGKYTFQHLLEALLFVNMHVSLYWFAHN